MAKHIHVHIHDAEPRGKSGPEVAADYLRRARECYIEANVLAEKGKHADAETKRREGDRLHKLGEFAKKGGEII